MKTKNIALTISIVAFAIGFSDFRENIFFWAGRPIGAIAFVFFMISMFLEKEFALMDKQENEKWKALNDKIKSATPSPDLNNTDGNLPYASMALKQMNYGSGN